MCGLVEGGDFDGENDFRWMAVFLKVDFLIEWEMVMRVIMIMVG